MTRTIQVFVPSGLLCLRQGDRDNLAYLGIFGTFGVHLVIFLHGRSRADLPPTPNHERAKRQRTDSRT